MNKERLSKVLLAPHISEKASVAADRDRQFVFKVMRDASKAEIKGAVEQMFDVQVQDVRVLNTKGKTKRFGQTFGRRSGAKKAYVTLKEGFDIELAVAQ